jgi:membrane-bound serine protease (ClpP class)
MMRLLSLAAAAASPATAATAAAEAGSTVALIWGVVLLGVALVLLLLELFVPSGGLISVVAGVALVGSVAAFFTHDPVWGFTAGGVYVVLSPWVIVTLLRFWTHSRVGRRLVLGGDEEDYDSDPEAAAARSEQARQRRVSELAALVGSVGVAETSLRPVGTVRIGDRRVDALAESGIIDAGSPVEVVAAHDNQIKVRVAR